MKIIIIQADLQLKVTMGEAEKVIRKLLDLSNRYKTMYDSNEISGGLAVLTAKECERELDKIRNLL